MKHILDLPGGSTKAPGILAKVEKLINGGYKPDTIFAVSVTALMSIPIATSFKNGSTDVIKQLINRSVNITIGDIFKVKPIGKIGGFSLIGLWRLITGKRGIGVQDVDGLINQFIKPGDITDYINDDQIPDIFVSFIEYGGSTPEFIRLKDLSTEKDVKDAIKASAAMPFYTEGHNFQGSLSYDSGMTDQTSFGKYMSLKHISGIESVKSVFVRSNDHDNIYDKKKQKAMDVMAWQQRVRNYESSINDEFTIKTLCKNNGIDHESIVVGFPPDMGDYETDNRKLLKLYLDNKD